MLLSLWRLTNQTCAETPIRIWEFCDSRKKKREREQDTACQSQKKSQRGPLFKSCQHTEWEETCQRSKNKSRQGNLTFCNVKFPCPPHLSPPWQSQSGTGVNVMKRKKRVEKKWKHDRLNCSGTPPTHRPLINISWSAHWGRAEVSQEGEKFRSIGGDSASPSWDKMRQDLGFQQRPCLTLHRSRFTQHLCLRKALIFKTSQAGGRRGVQTSECRYDYR